MNYCHLRVIRADDQWLSPTTAGGGGDTLAIAFGLNRVLWGEDGAELMAAAAELEAALAPFDAKPHWGKLSTGATAATASAATGARIEGLYGERLLRFRALAEGMDPAGKFRNAHVARFIFGEA